MDMALLLRLGGHVLARVQTEGAAAISVVVGESLSLRLGQQVH